MLEIVTKVFSIIVLNIILSGDNAVVIALATRKLAVNQRKKAILIGTIGAVILRILLMLVAIQLLTLPFLKVIGSILLLYIAYDLLVSNEEDSESIKGSGSFLVAIRTIILADLVMSLDNILAIAGVSADNNLLAIFGLIISIPIVIFGSQLILNVMERFPIVVWIGALLIAYTAGKMFIEDQLIKQFVHTGILAMMVPFAFCAILYGLYLVIGRRVKARVE